jgi:cupin fold WbuC family metalloprotein
MQIKIDTELLNDLTERAKGAPRLRMNYDLRTSEGDGSQRMLNAIEPESVVPVHRHRRTSETMVVLRGRVVEEFYDDAGACVESIEMSAGSDVCLLNIPAGTWHTLRSLESGTVILEMKDGAFEPLAPEDIMNVVL